MCGIIGLIAKNNATGFTYKQRLMFEQMLYIDALRGPDSTGVFCANKYGNVTWAKEASESGKFLEHKEAVMMMSDMTFKGVIMVGHNRRATYGKVVDENAHPFIEENIILVHNGTLRNHKDLNKDVEVDSHAIAFAIKEHGVSKAISKIEGAFAVAAYDIKAKKFYLFRNNERPLWMAESDDFWVFASEPWIFTGTAWRNEQKLKQPVQIDSGKLYTFTIEEKEIVKTEKTVKLHKHLPVVYTPPVKPKEKAKVVPIGQKKGGMDIIDSITQFSKEDVVCFKPLALRENGKYSKIEGTHYKVPEIKIVCFIDSHREQLHKLMAADLLCAEVTSVNADATLKTATVYCKDISISDPVYTINEILNEEQLQRLDGTCSQCNGIIDDNDMEDTFYKEQGTIVKHYCPMCVIANVAKNPQWGGLHQKVVAA